MIKRLSVNNAEFGMKDPGGKDSILNYAVKHGVSEYEYPLPKIIELFASKRPGVYVDAGANTGLFSLIFAKANRRNRVVAFECLHSIAEVLRENVRLNRLGRRIAIREIALSEETGKAYFKETDDDPGFIPTCSTLVEPIDPDWHVTARAVHTDTIDNQLRQLGLAPRKVKLMKVDVEGFEEAVLKGAAQTIRQDRPIIVVELLKKTNLDFFNNFVRSNHYKSVLLYKTKIEIEAEIRYKWDSWNHALVPDEKLGEFVNLYLKAIEE